eukprot:GHVT01091264.1.p1 GENE.GHVT01091264.1~~GHVT01091264.1.p1  ORF type:complete len:187 (-),score=45.69 GHVT01091264.1:231-791(-)
MAVIRVLRVLLVAISWSLVLSALKSTGRTSSAAARAAPPRLIRGVSVDGGRRLAPAGAPPPSLQRRPGLRFEEIAASQQISSEVLRQRVAYDKGRIIIGMGTAPPSEEAVRSAAFSSSSSGPEAPRARRLQRRLAVKADAAAIVESALSDSSVVSKHRVLPEVGLIVIDVDKEVSGRSERPLCEPA